MLTTNLLIIASQNLNLVHSNIHIYLVFTLKIQRFITKAVYNEGREQRGKMINKMLSMHIGMNQV